jgi:hypothetical protein
LAERCEFEDSDFEIMLQIVLKRLSSRLRKQALHDPKITLKDLPIAGRQLEMSSFQAANIEQKQGEQEEVRTLHKNTRQPQSKKHIAVSKLWQRMATTELYYITGGGAPTSLQSKKCCQKHGEFSRLLMPE